MQTSYYSILKPSNVTVKLNNEILPVIVLKAT